MITKRNCDNCAYYMYVLILNDAGVPKGVSSNCKHIRTNTCENFNLHCTEEELHQKIRMSISRIAQERRTW